LRVRRAWGSGRCLNAYELNSYSIARHVDSALPLVTDPRLCWCGTVAIGRCQRCGIWVCAPHSTASHIGQPELGRLCTQHAKEAQAAYFRQRDEGFRPLREEAERRAVEQRRQQERGDSLRQGLIAGEQLLAGVAGVVVYALTRSGGLARPWCAVIAGTCLGFFLVLARQANSRVTSQIGDGGREGYGANSFSVALVLGAPVGAVVGGILAVTILK